MIIGPFHEMLPNLFHSQLRISTGKQLELKPEEESDLVRCEA